PATNPSVLNESATPGGRARGGSLIPSSSPRELTTPRVWTGSMTCASAAAWLKRKPLGRVVNSVVGGIGPPCFAFRILTLARFHEAKVKMLSISGVPRWLHRRNAQLFCHPHQIGQRAGPHLLHNAPALDFNGEFGGP